MTKLSWWQTGIIYQVYPRSFQDTNGDGIGDLPGVRLRLPYLQELGVKAVWLSPIYPSPMADFGYDVADYRGIHPIFGSMDDFDRLLDETHRRGMKLMLDLVPNHTSDEHPWFLESRSGRDNPKRDWYIWRDPAPGGGAPNNWLSHFGGPAWEFDAHTGQYYLHLFAKQQPDLNYRNPLVEAAMLDNVRFWLDKGVDGFRVDVIWMMMKDAAFRDEPPDPDWDGVRPLDSQRHINTSNLPEVHSLIARFRRVLDEYDERMMVGEIYLPVEELVKYYGPHMDECHLPFNFQLIAMTWQAQTVRRAVDAYEAALPPGAWPNWVLGNHDRHRVATRVGRRQAAVANMLLLTLRGAPTTYYGEEIGMENVPVPIEQALDPNALNQPALAHIYGRDPERTPMQWDTSPNAGFCPAGVKPWLPIAADFALRNAALQEKDPASMLNLYRALAHLRSTEPALHAGSYASLESGVEDVFAYIRTDEKTSFVVALNFGDMPHRLDLSRAGRTGRIEISTGMDRTGDVELSNLELSANEGLLVRMEG